MARKRRARKVQRILAEVHADARCELDYRNPFELLVATVLSAQCTDVRVNQVTKVLFSAYPTPEALAGADLSAVEDIVHPTGFFRAKASNIVALARRLVGEYEGAVPPRLEDLVTLAGVGRKTANVVLGNAFGIPGLTIDTHVGRQARRMAWTVNEDPVAVERDLAAIFEPEGWTILCHHLIFHGRRYCHSRKPACGACPVAAWCPSFGVGQSDPEQAAKLVRWETEVMLARKQYETQGSEQSA